jgi:hypothetical protein
VNRGNNWLIQNLLPPSENVLGCEINIPDQVIIENGKPKLFVKTEKETGCMQRICKQKTIVNDALRHLIFLGDERKKLASID